MVKCKYVHIHIGKKWREVHKHMGFPDSSGGKESACHCRRHRFNPWVGKIPWRRKCQPTLVLWPGKSHGQRILGGYNPWVRKRVGHELTTKQQSFLTLWVQVIVIIFSAIWHFHGCLRNLKLWYI